MSNSTIKVFNKNIYSIDITDENDNIAHTIKMNLGDANFPVKVINFYDEVYKEMESIKIREEELKKEIIQEGHTEVPEIKNVTEENIENFKDILSPAMRRFFLFEAEGYSKLRELLDRFLGAGTCEAVFGDCNDKEMFADFLNSLLPEFEKMGVRMQNIQKNLYEKYAPKNKMVL